MEEITFLLVAEMFYSQLTSNIYILLGRKVADDTAFFHPFDRAPFDEPFIAHRSLQARRINCRSY